VSLVLRGAFARGPLALELDLAIAPGETLALVAAIGLTPLPLVGIAAWPFGLAFCRASARRAITRPLPAS
jgi:hypothetical protein